MGTLCCKPGFPVALHEKLPGKNKLYMFPAWVSNAIVSLFVMLSNYFCSYLVIPLPQGPGRRKERKANAYSKPNRILPGIITGGFLRSDCPDIYAFSCRGGYEMKAEGSSQTMEYHFYANRHALFRYLLLVQAAPLSFPAEASLSPQGFFFSFKQNS